jgi:hypothetical protein
MEQELRLVRLEEEVYAYKSVLKIPRSYLSPFLKYICGWLSQRYLGRFLKEIHSKGILL